MKMHGLFTVLLILCVASTGLAQGFGDRTLINQDWSFHLGDIPYGGREYLDHSDWRVLNLPHDWSVEGTACSHLSSCTGFLPGGIAWYRKSLDVPAQRKGQQVYIYFGGVYNNSEVFINGKWVGKRPNGYLPFLYDLTSYIKFGQTNTVAVRVDHRDYADSRWYTGSGIYRDVFWIYANPIHIDLWGVHYTATLDGDDARLDIDTTLRDRHRQSRSGPPVTVTQEVFDADGQSVASASTPVDVIDRKRIRQTLSLANPMRWGTDTPYLYTLKTQLQCRGDILDQTTTRVGIRTTRFDSRRGFFLNGVSTKLKGVCIHHDAGCLGAAVPKEVWRRRLEILKGIGCNAIRTAHNPQATDLYELCDELGFLVIDEAYDEWEYPKNKWITGWNHGEPGLQGSATYFREWGRRDLGDLIRRDRNHPSIIMWSIGNEIDYPQDPYSHPILNQEGIRQKHKAGHITSHPRAERLGEIARELVAVVKKYDTSRPVTAGLAAPIMSNETDYPYLLDVVGYNYTESRYEQDHKTYPGRVLYGSENGSSLRSWKIVTDNDYILGQFLWTGYDFLGESGRWPSRGSTAGHIDCAGNIKPRGYFRKALWYESPTAYLGTYPFRNERRPSVHAPALWNYRAGEKIRVVCYTNCAAAELLLNGKAVGARKAYDKDTGIIHWDVRYAPGELKVLAYEDGVPQAQAVVATVGNACTLAAESDKKRFRQRGEVAHVMVSLRDENGRVALFADNELTFDVSDNAVLLGTENSSTRLPDNFKDHVQRCQNGKVLLYIQSVDPSKPATIKISTPLFEDVVVTIDPVSL